MGFGEHSTENRISGDAGERSVPPRIGITGSSFGFLVRGLNGSRSNGISGIGAGFHESRMEKRFTVIEPHAVTDNGRGNRDIVIPGLNCPDLVGIDRGNVNRAVDLGVP